MDKKVPHPLFKLATELGPLLVFFVANAKSNKAQALAPVRFFNPLSMRFAKHATRADLEVGDGVHLAAGGVAGLEVPKPGRLEAMQPPRARARPASAANRPQGRRKYRFSVITRADSASSSHRNIQHIRRCATPRT